ncbi:MAG: fluoride efflux transporter CrcB [Bacteroidia bacterium]|nr:fluoride efflux transporter CrcB [Bacteroidia bacterium]
MQLFYIFIGGGVGSVLRFLIGKLLPAGCFHGFPVGTLMANLLGCLLIGIFNASVARYINPDLKVMLTVGLCGGFTTMSTFCNESISMVNGGQWLLLSLYITSTILGGLFMVYIGGKI